MTTEITKEKIFNDLNELKDALEFPNLYMANYFNDLRKRDNYSKRKNHYF